MKRRIVIGSMLIASVLGSGFLLRGCFPSGSASDAEHIQDLILEKGGGVEDVLVNFKTDVFVRHVNVALSMPGVAAEDVVEIGSAIDAALEIAWLEAPFDPSTIFVEVVLDPFEDGVTANRPVVFGYSLNLDAVSEAYNLPGDTGMYGLSASDSYLSGAYGPRS